MPVWVIVWLTISAIIQTYDACYVLLGPLSHDGGPLAGFWPGHVFYGSFDQRYSQFDAFGSAQSWANLLEVIVIVWALAHAKRWSGVVVGLIVTVATFWKTVIYFLVEISSGARDDASVARAGVISSASSWSPCCRICSGSSSRSPSSSRSAVRCSEWAARHRLR